MTTKATKTAKTSTTRSRKPAVEKRPYAEVVAERIIEALRNGTAPWINPWAPGRPGAATPFNPTTGNPYKGMNSLVLSMAGFSDTRWMTFKQALLADACVRKGEKGTQIQYWSFESSTVKKDEDGKVVKDREGKSVKETKRFGRPRCFTATVFNAEQIDGLGPLVLPDFQHEQWSPIERVEDIVKQSGAKVQHEEGDRAFYTPGRDRITMPIMQQFPDPEAYYATLLHELGHWTGHSSRLNRDLTGSFGSESYAKEELRAEIASFMLGDQLGIGHDPGQHAAYVQSWIKILENDHLEIFRAASDAEKIKQHIMAFDKSLNKYQELDTDHENDVQHDAVSRFSDNSMSV